MITPDQITLFKENFHSAQSVIIIVSSQATLDQLASAIAIYEGASSQGKQVLLVSPETRLQQRFSELTGLDKIQTQLGNRDLSVSFEYNPLAVDKVSYHIDESSQRFVLVIKPQKGQSPLDPGSLQTSYTGAEADLLILVGIHNLEDLEHLYFGYENLYETTPLVTLHTFEPNIGTLKLDVSGTSSISESTTILLQHLNVALSGEAASNLLIGIETATQNFSPLLATAETFEAVAYLLRSGARRATRSVPLPSDLNSARPPQSSKKNKTKTLQPDGTSQKIHAEDVITKKEGGLDLQPSQFSPSGRN